MTSAATTIPPALLPHADPEKINAAIKDLWRAMAEPPQAETALLRSAALTLVVVLQSTTALPNVLTAVTQLSQFHPARTILVVPDESVPPGETRSEVYMSCSQWRSSQKQVCLEQVALFASPKEMHLLSHTILGLFVEDMPRYLWWQSSIAPDDLLMRRLVDVVDRVIVDSKASTRNALQSAFALLQKYPNALVSDLNWGRITQWRSAIAQSFDSPAAWNDLEQLGSVEISVAICETDSSRIPTSTLLLAAWIAYRLHWQLLERVELAPASTSEGRIATLFFQMANVEIPIHITAINRAKFAGRIVSLRFYVKGTENAKYEVERSTDMQHATLRIQTGPAIIAEQCTNMGPVPLTELLAGEIGYVSRDEGYEASVKEAHVMEKLVSA